MSGLNMYEHSECAYPDAERLIKKHLWKDKWDAEFAKLRREVQREVKQKVVELWDTIVKMGDRLLERGWVTSEEVNAMVMEELPPH